MSSAFLSISFRFRVLFFHGIKYAHGGRCEKCMPAKDHFGLVEISVRFLEEMKNSTENRLKMKTKMEVFSL